MLGLFIVSLKSVASGMSQWDFPVSGTSTTWELHVIKNNGMDTHVKFRCGTLSECWDEFEQIKYRSNEFQCAKNVWMERLDSQIHIIK